MELEKKIIAPAAEFQNWGPYLSFGNDPATEMRISWESEHITTMQWVAYGQTEECEILIKNEWISPTHHHCIILKDLFPNTKYYYKISRDIVGKNNIPGIFHPTDPVKELKDTPTYSFTTGLTAGDSSQPFDFCIMGDIHTEHRNVKPGFKAMKKNVPENRMLLTVGDSIDNGLSEKSWRNYFHQTSEFMTDVPTMNATGNHDTSNPAKYARYIKTWDHPYHNVQKGAYYTFIFGNAVFIMLDSDNAGQMGGVISDDQMDWLEETLEEYAKKNYWIFVCLHHQIYSTGDFGMPEVMNLAFRDLFDEYHVDGVFYGHDHHFEEFWTGREESWGGTHYFVAGSGGSNLDTHIRNKWREPTPPNYVWQDRTYIFDRDGILPGDPVKGVRNDDVVKKSQVFGILEHSFVHMKIDGDVCKIQLIGWENQIYYEDTFKRTGTGKKYHAQSSLKKYM